MHYVHENGHYVLFDEDEQILPAFKEVGILYSDNPPQPDGLGSVLLKHGDANLVQAKFMKTRRQYVKAGLIDEAKALRMIRSPDLPIEELNKCISICDYAGRMVERLGLQVLVLHDSITPQPLRKKATSDSDGPSL